LTVRIRARANVRQFEAGKDAIPMIAFAISVLAAWLCFGAQAKMAFGKIRARGLKAMPLVIGAFVRGRIDGLHEGV